MRIDFFTCEGTVTEDLRAYAEYRLFSALGEHASRIESISVRVEARDMATTAAEVTCSMVAHLLPRGAVRTMCAASHAAAAIDRATARVAKTISTCLSGTDRARRAALSR